MSEKYEKQVYLAMLAEQCNRFEEMVTFLEEMLSTRDKDLNSDERNLLSIAYKNSVSSRRTALRTITAYETKEKKKETSTFLPYIQEYKILMNERKQYEAKKKENKQWDPASEHKLTANVDALYEKIRTQVIDKVTVRRTRNNILNNPDYKADLEAQGIIFPKILPPNELEYAMSDETKRRFYKTDIHQNARVRFLQEQAFFP